MKAKAGHWVNPEKAMQSLGCASQENCSNVGNTWVCKYGACDFLLRKNGCSGPSGLLQFFAVTAAVMPPWSQIARPSQSAHQVNIAYWYCKVIR